MEFIDLAAQQARIKGKIDLRIEGVLKHGSYIMGQEVKELEGTLAAYAGVKFGIGCASGTDALLISLMAFGVGPGDAIFTTPFTFIATAEVISLLGATPVFVDIDPKTFNIDPVQLRQAIEAVGHNDASFYKLPRPAVLMADSRPGLTPKGIICVDLFGLPAKYDSIDGVARDHNLFVIEDAAQSFGAEYKGKKACSLANIACTSFFPAKPLGCYGDGGMCFTNDQNLAKVIRSIGVHGKGNHKYDNIRIGINGRLDTLQAAILMAKMDIFPEEMERRQQVAKRYADLINVFQVQEIPEEVRSAWAQYSLLAKDENQRSLLMDKLKKAGIPTAIYYPKPLHLQAAFAGLRYKRGDFPISEDIASRIFSLPMHPYLSANDQERIVRTLKDGRNQELMEGSRK